MIHNEEHWHEMIYKWLRCSLLRPEKDRRLSTQNVKKHAFFGNLNFAVSAHLIAYCRISLHIVVDGTSCA